MEKRGLIFLDIDGVLVHPTRGPLGKLRQLTPDPECVRLLNELTRDGHADIVVSSTWRKGGLEEIAATLQEWGVHGRVIGVTPDMSWSRPEGVVEAKERGTEIVAYLDNYFGYCSLYPPFAILDDDDMGSLREHLIQTDPMQGLTREDVTVSLILLTAQRNPGLCTVDLGMCRFCNGEKIIERQGAHG